MMIAESKSNRKEAVLPAPIRPALTKRLADATRPAMVQAAPGRWVPYKREVPPDISLCRWQGNGDGTFSPLPYTERLTRLNAKLAALLGFPGQYQTLLRLGRAGFVEIVMAAPHVGLINLDSYFNHLRRCAEDPEFWAPGSANRKEYSKAIF